MKKIVLQIVTVLLGFSFLVAIVFFATPYFSKKDNFSSLESIRQAEAAFKSGDIDKAISLAEEVLVKNPNDIPALEFLASAYAQKGSVEYKESEYAAKAEDIANRIISIDPSNSEALRTLGYSYEIRNDFKKATEFYTKALSVDPTNASVLSNRAHAEWLSGDTKSAEKDYTSALSFVSNLGHALLGLATIKSEQEKYDEARTLLAKALSESDITIRQKASAEQLIGSTYLGELKAGDSLPHFEKAIEYDSKLESAWVGKGRSNMLLLANAKTGDEFRSTFTESVNDFKQAVDINPNYSRGFVGLGDLLSLVKDPTAKVFYVEALRVLPGDNTLTIGEKKTLSASMSF